MIKDLFVSFGDNIKEKTKNPFLGTYVGVWIIRNWEFIYMLFNFDKDCSMDEKIVAIEIYFKRSPLIENLFWNILISFGVLILTYLLLNLSRLIVNVFEKKLTPWVYKITDKNSIVTKDEYNKLQVRYTKLESDIANEREKRYKEEQRADKLEKEMLEGNIQKSFTKPEDQSDSKIGDKASLIFDKIDKNDYNDLKALILSIKKGKRIKTNDNNEIIDFMISHNLIEFATIGSTESFVKMTKLGERVSELLNEITTS
ncbi:hypothetical protein ACPDHL_11980 [Myroides sp. C15-4]|uniref:hypothetical protein n=1 Tax=Myroides sp. C15-4 TaxID=3400532 RepID=UPI003D2F76B4